MSLNISDASSTTSAPALARPAVPAGQGSKRASVHVSDGADAVAKPRSLSEEPENPVMRAHPTAPTDDSLQRLREAAEPGRSRYRVRKGAAESDDRPEPFRAARKARSPYDPPPTTQRDLDILA